MIRRILRFPELSQMFFINPLPHVPREILGNSWSDLKVLGELG
jgi:hypothetical protein